MDAWKPLIAIVIMLGSILGLAWWVGYKDRQYLAGKLDRPLPQWLCIVLLILPFAVLAVFKYFDLWHLVE